MHSTAKGMKVQAKHLNKRMVRDQDLIEQIERKQESGISATRKEDKRVKELTRTAWMSFCTRLFWLALSVCVFVFMVSFIWMFPRRTRQL